MVSVTIVGGSHLAEISRLPDDSIEQHAVMVCRLFRNSESCDGDANSTPHTCQISSMCCVLNCELLLEHMGQNLKISFPFTGKAMWGQLERSLGIYQVFAEYGAMMSQFCTNIRFSRVVHVILPSECLS